MIKDILCKSCIYLIPKYEKTINGRCASFKRSLDHKDGSPFLIKNCSYYRNKEKALDGSYTLREAIENDNFVIIISGIVVKTHEDYINNFTAKGVPKKNINE